jgi:hypothetical protein
MYTRVFMQNKETKEPMKYGDNLYDFDSKEVLDRSFLADNMPPEILEAMGTGNYEVAFEEVEEDGKTWFVKIGGEILHLESMFQMAVPTSPHLGNMYGGLLDLDKKGMPGYTVVPTLPNDLIGNVEFVRLPTEETSDMLREKFSKADDSSDCENCPDKDECEEYNDKMREEQAWEPEKLMEELERLADPIQRLLRKHGRYNTIKISATELDLFENISRIKSVPEDEDPLGIMSAALMEAFRDDDEKEES